MKYLNLKPVEFDALGKRNQAAFKWEGRILMPKYDGCFAMVAFFAGKPDYIMSRTGEAVRSMDHVFVILKEAYPELVYGKDGVMFLGEAWTEGKEFSELSGMFRRQRPQPGLGFKPFDVVRYNHDADPCLPTLWSERTYEERLRSLGILPTLAKSKEHAWSYALAHKELGGYDGAICSDPHANYIPGAGKGGEFIKLKPLLSYSLECIDYETATGEKTGRETGALVVRFKGGKPLRVATGLSNEQQTASELSKFVGKVIEVEAMGISSKGLLREPRFKGVRDDATPDF